MWKHILQIVLLISVYSCSQNLKNKAVEGMIQNKDSIPITWIEVPDSLSNFDALLKTNHLYYLEQMFPENDDLDTDFWQKIDTLQNTDWLFTIQIQGACTAIKDSILSDLLCVETRKHVINKNLEKVIQFSGTGSGFFATIDFVYDDASKLLEYKDFNKDEVFYLKYDKIGQLIEIMKTKTTHGVKREKERFKFRKSSSLNLRTES